jgi:ABC-type multidrug transport system fused ATPase/permease subunit
MNVGELWELIALLSLLFAQARAIGGVFVQMQSALAAWGRLDELWGEQGESDGSPSDVSLKGDICFNKLCFRYLQEKPLLENVNITVKGGSLVFLTGPNGCGKSTLLSLLLRLYKPLGGDVTIGGRSITEFPLKGLRSRIGYIGQSPEFIKGNLRENLLLGNNGRTDEEIMAAGRMAGCESLIASRGLGSAVEEEAGNFSGGEKLRLALARELLRDTDILLFDEPAAHLDSENRRAFYNLLQGLGSGKTVIAVVHNIPEGISVPIISLPLNN